MHDPKRQTPIPVQTSVFVRFAQPGFHHWPGAHGQRAYLGQPHRHTFRVRVETDVQGEDRELEFHDLHDLAAEQFAALATEHRNGIPDFLGRSCEMLARELGARLGTFYAASGPPDRLWAVTVEEDDGSGATVVTLA
jgi:hypothetical protein